MSEKSPKTFENTREDFDKAVVAAAQELICQGHYKLDPNGKPELCSQSVVRVVVKAIQDAGYEIVKVVPSVNT
jgi:hypothetical protein